MKTLKDIYFPCKDLECLVITKNLQDVAREWIKELDKDEREIMEKYPNIFHDFEPSCEIGVVTNWIKMFFNIEDEIEGEE